MILVAAASAFHVWLVKPALDGIFIDKNHELLIFIPILVVIVAFIKGVAAYYQNYLIKVIGQRMVNDIQLELYQHLVYSDIEFLKNPFEEFEYDFTKFNFLSIEPEFTELPIVNDTFVVFPHSMTQNLINAIVEMEITPPHGINVGMHNLYIPMCNQVGKENVKIVSDDMYLSKNKNLYRLTRHE
jgi:ABC-type multidrug transport system fused ATPase/permease subunit